MPPSKFATPLLALLGASLLGCTEPAYLLNAEITVAPEIAQRYSESSPGVLILSTGYVHTQAYKLCSAPNAQPIKAELGGLGCPDTFTIFIAPALPSDTRPCGEIQEGVQGYPENPGDPSWPQTTLKVARPNRASCDDETVQKVYLGTNANAGNP